MQSIRTNSCCHKIFCVTILLSTINISSMKCPLIYIIYLQIVTARGCSQCVYTVCVCANLPSPSHITLLAGSSVATPVQFSRLTASDHSGRLHLDVDNKPAEDYVKLTTSVCSGSTHLQLEP
jgi:hypothetical protein